MGPQGRRIMAVKPNRRHACSGQNRSLYGEPIDKLQIEVKAKNVGSGNAPYQVDGIVVIGFGRDLWPRSGGYGPKVHVENTGSVMAIVVPRVDVQKWRLSKAPKECSRAEDRVGCLHCPY